MAAYEPADTCRAAGVGRAGQRVTLTDEELDLASWDNPPPPEDPRCQRQPKQPKRKVPAAGDNYAKELKWVFGYWYTLEQCIQIMPTFTEEFMQWQPNIETKRRDNVIKYNAKDVIAFAMTTKEDAFRFVRSAARRRAKHTRYNSKRRT
jgi:hypothetical protein